MTTHCPWCGSTKPPIATRDNLDLAEFQFGRTERAIRLNPLDLHRVQRRRRHRRLPQRVKGENSGM